MATIQFTGNLAADPELRYTRTGKAVANFTVIENQRRRDEQGQWVDDEPNVFRVEAWGQLAINLSKSARKGEPLAISGRVKTDRFEDKNTKASRTAQHVIADEVSYSLRWHTVTGQRNEPQAETAPAEQWAVADIPDGDTPF